MALVWMDSFDHYATAHIFEKYNTGAGDPAITAADGRFGTFSVVLDAGDAVIKNLPSQATYIIGVAVKFDSAAVAANILSFDDSGSIQCALQTDATGRLQVMRAGTTNIGTGSIVLLSGTYYYLEMKLTVHNSTGVAVVRVNGVTDINLSGVDTQNSANATANQARLISGHANRHYDDFYVCDTSGGAPNNDFLGDVRVQALFPSGNGNSSQFDGSDGNSIDNYLLVDETAGPDDDTTYVESSDVGDKDTYAYGDLTPSAGTVYGVQIIPSAKKTDAGARSIKTVARLSATETDGPDQSLTTDYIYFPDIRETKPGGGVWTISDVNSAEFGVKVSV